MKKGAAMLSIWFIGSVARLVKKRAWKFGSIQNLAAFVGKGAMNYIAPTQKERWLNKKVLSRRGKLHALYKNIELHATGMKHSDEALWYVDVMANVP